MSVGKREVDVGAEGNEQACSTCRSTNEWTEERRLKEWRSCLQNSSKSWSAVRRGMKMIACTLVEAKLHLPRILSFYGSPYVDKARRGELHISNASAIITQKDDSTCQCSHDGIADKADPAYTPISSLK